MLRSSKIRCVDLASQGSPRPIAYSWERELEDTGFEYTSSNSGSTVVPVGSFVQPINEDFSFGFTVLGFGISDDLGDWPGRYFIQSYDSISVSAYPSLAYRVSEQLSIAGIQRRRV